MYDEITRQQDHYWASLAYAQEEGRAEGRAEGREEGRAEGMEEAIITLMKNGHISPEVAAAQLKINIEELNKYLQKDIRKTKGVKNIEEGHNIKLTYDLAGGDLKIVIS